MIMASSFLDFKIKKSIQETYPNFLIVLELKDGTAQLIDTDRPKSNEVFESMQSYYNYNYTINKPLRNIIHFTEITHQREGILIRDRYKTLHRIYVKSKI